MVENLWHHELFVTVWNDQFIQLLLQWIICKRNSNPGDEFICTGESLKSGSKLATYINGNRKNLLRWKYEVSKRLANKYSLNKERKGHQNVEWKKIATAIAASLIHS